MKSYIAPRWRQQLAEQGLLSFETLWNIELPAIDEANTNRGGISTVGLMAIPGFDGTAVLIVKRQHNHNSRTLRHPFGGIPTFEKEFNNILTYTRRGIATLSPVYFAKRKDTSGTRAILVSEYLKGYLPLDDCPAVLEEVTPGTRYTKKRRLIREVARFVRRLHDRGMVHNCLYPKHIFVAETDAGIDLRIIDLEKSRPYFLRKGGILKDLETLRRRSHGWSRTDFLRFLLAYQGRRYPAASTRRLLGRIMKRTRRKLER